MTILNFQSALANFGGEVYEAHGKLIKRVARSIVTDVIAGTPVDTGHAKGNWQIGINSAPTNELSRNDPTGSETLQECMSEITKAKSGDIIVLTNNVPYIQELEYGHSNQAPNGMVSVAVEKARLIE